MTTTTATSLLSTLSSAATASAVQDASATTSAAASSSGSSVSAATSTNALTQLSSNFDDFLKLLTTQLQNQDPSSPMDTNEFTTQLVQFSGVEQQVQTNTNLTQLLQLTEQSELDQSSSLVGKSVSISGNVIPLQSSQAQLRFTTQAAEPIAISITNAAGQDVKDVVLESSAGSNSWTWNGTSNTGAQLADGAYNVAVKTIDQTGTVSDVPFSSIGTLTNVQKGGSGLTASFGSAQLDATSIQSLAS